MTVVDDYAAVTPEWIAATAAEMQSDALARIEAIEALADDELTFDSTVGALDDAMDVLALCYGKVAFLGQVHTDETVRAAAQEVEREQAKLEIDLWCRDGLWSRISAYAASPEAAALPADATKLLDDTMQALRASGHELGPEAKDELNRLSKRSVELSSQFAVNLGEIRTHVDIPRDELTGMSEPYLDSLEPGDEPGTVRVTSAYPHVLPVMDNATDRRWREAVQRMAATRAVEENLPLLEEQVALRKQIAGLFGEPTWAHHRLHPRMARTPETVAAFYDDLLPGLTAAGQRERDLLAAMLDADLQSGAAQGDPVLGVQDWRYYDTQQRKALHGVDQQLVSQHLALDTVLQGLLDVTGEVLGLRYRRVERPTWHPDVFVVEILDADDDRVRSTVYVDLFPRPGKFTHAAAFDLVKGRLMPDGSYRQPVSALLANFTAPTADGPSLLTYQEMTTLFHEWGHILHQGLTEARFSQQSGANVEWDFVEAPSQILEHWAWDPGVVSRFARHHVTGDPIPDDLLKGVVAGRYLNEGLRALRQAALGLMDQKLHGPDVPVDVEAVLDLGDRVSLVPRLPGTCSLAQFGHTMGGYDAGYYGYLWSQVFGDDMFSVFAEAGVTNPEVGRRYREAILAKGGSEDGMSLLRGFLGREPSKDAFLRAKGLLG